jgi:type IV pilus biogenesis protein PilP
MNANAQAISTMSSRQKLSAGILVLITMVILWQAYGMFSGGRKFSTAKPDNHVNAFSFMKTAANNPAPQANMQQTQSPQSQPQQAQLPSLAEQSGETDRERELIALQQQTQAKYLAALNELQMLKVAKDIAEANQAIMTARLSTVTSEKSIVDMLAPPAQPAVSQNGPMGVNAARMQAPSPYSVVSIAMLQNRWTAVLSNKNILYNVSVGDILPSDGSRVVEINRTGVTLDLYGEKRKLSMVPII